MKTKRAIQRELREIENLLCRFHKGQNINAAIKRGKCKLPQQDKDILYGAAQALGWLLNQNYMRPSRVVRIQAGVPNDE